MTERENFLKVLSGEKPEWIPIYRDASEWIFAGFAMEHFGPPEFTDVFGKHWIPKDGGMMADTSQIIIEDITKWKDYIDLPDLDAMDWKAMSERDLANHDPEKAIIFLGFLIPGGNFFIPLMNLMGFENGLIAIYEEPEAVAEFNNYLCSYMEKMITYGIQYYHPDMVIIADDFATAKGPFISQEVYNELYLPYFQRLARIVKYAGLFLEFHCCGRCEDFVDSWVEMGVNMWQPAQTLNDLDAIRAKYGTSLVFNGSWQGGPSNVPGVPEEEVRKSAHEVIDRFAKDGGYVFWDGDPVGSTEDMLKKFEWVTDEARKYGKEFYKSI